MRMVYNSPTKGVWVYVPLPGGLWGSPYSNKPPKLSVLFVTEPWLEEALGWIPRPFGPSIRAT